MRRREFIVGLGGVAAVWSVGSRRQLRPKCFAPSRFAFMYLELIAARVWPFAVGSQVPSQIVHSDDARLDRGQIDDTPDDTPAALETAGSGAASLDLSQIFGSAEPLLFALALNVPVGAQGSKSLYLSRYERFSRRRHIV